MFVAWNQVGNGHGMADWSDPRTFPALFHDNTGGDTGWVMGTLVNDGGPPTAAHFDTSRYISFIFYAKDKSTLVSGLGLCPNTVVIRAKNGESDLSFFSGAYDGEKLGGWIRNQARSAQAWSRFKATAAGQQFTAAGLGLADYARRTHRGRLRERGYFVMVGTSQVMRSARRPTSLHASEMPLGTVARLVIS